MSDFGEYGPNHVPCDALVVKESSRQEHALVQYTAAELSQAPLGPANPFGQAKKRKVDVLTGTATETQLSEYAFRSKHRRWEQRGGPDGQLQTSADKKEESAQLRAQREKKGDATIAEGPGSYVGPWARRKTIQEYEDVDDEGDLESDEEYEEVDPDDIVESGALVQAPTGSLAKRKEEENKSSETSVFHGSEEFDYQGRAWTRVPRDLDVDLEKEVGSITNFIPKRQIHAWKRAHSKPITSLRLFPSSSHLLLSGSADSTIKIWSCYGDRELMRSYLGHSKAVTDLHFNHDGTKFLSASFDRQIKLWDVETGKCIQRFTSGKTPHCIRFNNLATDHHNEFIAGMSDKRILQYDIRSGNEIVQDYDHHLGAIHSLVFCDEGRRFVSTSEDRSLRAWDYNIPVPIRYIAEIDMFPYTRGCLHPTGKYIVYQSSDNTCVVYGATDKFRQNRKKLYKGHHNAGTAIDLEVSPDGQFLASGDSGGQLVFWDWKTCRLLQQLKAGTEPLTCLQWSQQETSKLFTAGHDGQIRLWD